FFGLPLPLLPTTCISFTTLTASVSSLLNTCPSHLNLFSPILSTIEATPILPLIYSFLILSSLVTPLIHLNILISATLILCSIFLPTAQHSVPYIIAGLTTAL